MKNNPYKTLQDPVFLRYVAQNDYMVDGGFLPEGQRLNDIADRLDALATVENMEDKVVEEIHRESEDLRERIAELEAEVDECIRDRDEQAEQIKELQAKVSSLSMDAIQRLDDEIADRR